MCWPGRCISPDVRLAVSRVPACPPASVNLSGRLLPHLQITTMVLEGWSTKLNPDIRIMVSKGWVGGWVGGCVCVGGGGGGGGSTAWRAMAECWRQRQQQQQAAGKFSCWCCGASCLLPWREVAPQTARDHSPACHPGTASAIHPANCLHPCAPQDTLRDILPVAWGTRISKTLDRAFSPSSLALATL